MKKNEMGGACGTYGEARKIWGKGPRWRHSCWWDDVIKMDLKEVFFYNDGRMWTELVCFRIENRLMSYYTILSISLSPPCPSVPIVSSLPSSQTYPTLWVSCALRCNPLSQNFRGQWQEAHIGNVTFFSTPWHAIFLLPPAYQSINLYKRNNE